MNKMKRVLKVILFLLFLQLPAYAAPQAIDTVRFVTLRGAINSVMESFLVKQIDIALRKPGTAVVFLIDTPGGALESTRDIIQKMVNSDLPVLGFVYPPGSRAASAGAFIMLACDVNAMVPLANIGSAHPVMIGMNMEKLDKVMENKIVNDTLAYIANLAARNGRNVDIAKDMVLKSVNLTAADAVKFRIVDFEADGLDDLLKKLQGRHVLKNKQEFMFSAGPSREFADMTFLEKFLMIISDPNLAYIFLILGIYGLIAEFSTPGIGFGGIFGGISLILAFLSLSVISVNLTGLLLMMLALLLFIIEVKLQPHGLAAIGGVISFTLGSVMLIRNLTFGGATLSPVLIISMTVLTAVFFIVIIAYAVRSQRRKVETGSEGMKGQRGVVDEACAPEGSVLINGEIWKAVSLTGESLPKNEKITVDAIDGLVLKVRKAG